MGTRGNFEQLRAFSRQAAPIHSIDAKDPIVSVGIFFDSDRFAVEYFSLLLQSEFGPHRL